MLEELCQKPQDVVVVGDVFVSDETMARAVESSSMNVGAVHRVFWGDDSVETFSANQVLIEKNGPEAVPYPTELDQLIEDASVLVTHFAPIPASLINRGKNLRCILTCRGGLEQIDVAAASAKGIAVVNVIRNAEPVADFVLGLMLAVTRNIATAHAKMVRGVWSKDYPNYEYTTTFSNLTVGLAGLGNVGIAIARRLRALDVPVIGFDEYVSQDRLVRAGLEDVELVASLDELAERCDIVSVHLRLTDETVGLFDQAFFKKMGCSSYFINTSRGRLVNQHDLVSVLRNHEIAGAALDVFEQEPLSGETEFTGLDNVILTPHIAGDTVSAVPDSPFMLMREFDRMIATGSPERMVNYQEVHVA